VDSVELAAPFDSEKVNENGVRGDWEIFTKTPSKGDAWIRKSSQSLLTQKKVNENRVGADWEIITETPSKGDAWIWKRSQPLLTLKKSTKQLPKVTCGLGRARSPCDSEIVNEN
jgi:hypothetical protein